MPATTNASAASAPAQPNSNSIQELLQKIEQLPEDSPAPKDFRRNARNAFVFYDEGAWQPANAAAAAADTAGAPKNVHTLYTRDLEAYMAALQSKKPTTARNYAQHMLKAIDLGLVTSQLSPSEVQQARRVLQASKSKFGSAAYQQQRGSSGSAGARAAAAASAGGGHDHGSDCDCGEGEGHDADVPLASAAAAAAQGQQGNADNDPDGRIEMCESISSADLLRVMQRLQKENVELAKQLTEAQTLLEQRERQFQRLVRMLVSVI